MDQGERVVLTEPIQNIVSIWEGTSINYSSTSYLRSLVVIVVVVLAGVLFFSLWMLLKQMLA